MLTSTLNFFHSLLIKPITLIIASVLNALTELGLSEGWSIVVLSLIINTLILPLYGLSERIQTKERTIRKRLDAVVKRLKTVYKGVTLHFLTQYWYKQQAYHPIYALRSLLGFFIQVPFFIAAYQYIGHWHKLEGEHFLFLSNLSKPNGLLFGVNLLPVIMTVLNLASGFIYSKNLQRQDKVQLIALSLVFFVLLYAMPSGLLLYWTVKNLYSLLKNVLTHSTLFNTFQPNFQIPGIENFLEKIPFFKSKKRQLTTMVKWIDIFVWLGFFICFPSYIAYFDRSNHIALHTYFLWICFTLVGFLAFNGVSYFFFHRRSFKTWASLLGFILKLAFLLAVMLMAFLTLQKLIIDNRWYIHNFSYNVKIIWYDYAVLLLLLMSVYKYAPILLNALDKFLPQEILSTKQRNALFFFSSCLTLSILFIYSPLNIISSDISSFYQQTVMNGFNKFLSAGVSVLILFSIFYLLLSEKKAHSFVLVLTFITHATILFNFLPVPSMNLFQMEFESLPTFNISFFFRDVLVPIASFLISYFLFLFKKKKIFSSSVFLYST